MKGKTLLVILAAVLLMPALALAQIVPGPSNPKSTYVGWDDEAQSRNLPAGTVQDPGSHLTYIVDTGVNARKLAGVADLSGVEAAARTPLQSGSLLQPILDPEGDGFNEGSIFQNFLAIVNTHPTQAVTVHFRYYNDNCEDLLDFLVVVTCNDTLIFDPFNFVIPYTGGVNTRSRIIGPATDVLTPISVIQWGSGRFVITAAASATTINQDDVPEILFPKEWESLDEECNVETNGSLNLTEYTVAGLDDRIAGFKIGGGDSPTQGERNVGTVPGFSSNNLHVFNASQVAFNYLIGHLTTARPAAAGFDQTSWAVNAWARPVIDRSRDMNDNDEAVEGFFTMLNPTSDHFRFNPWVPAGGPNPDGDGPHFAYGTQLPDAGVLNYLIAWGGEPGRDSAGNGAASGFSNFKFLRNEVHGGDVAGLSYGTATMPGYAPDNVNQSAANVTVRGSDSWYGAIGTSAFHITDPLDQLIHFLSVADDYNGSNNTPLSASILRDVAANISPAVTTYVLQIYDNDENILTFDVPPGVPVSPPTISASSILKITCICLRTFRNFRNQSTNRDEFNGSTSVDDLELEDLRAFGNVFGVVGDFKGLLKVLDPYRTAGSIDSSGGWIRFVRDNTVRVYVPRDTGTSVEGQFSSGYGTSSFNIEGYRDNDPRYGQSFMTIGQYVLRFEGFGASWYLFAVASDPRVSETGDETP